MKLIGLSALVLATVLAVFLGERWLNFRESPPAYLGYALGPPTPTGVQDDTSILSIRVRELFVAKSEWKLIEDLVIPPDFHREFLACLSTGQPIHFEDQVPTIDSIGQIVIERQGGTAQTIRLYEMEGIVFQVVPGGWYMAFVGAKQNELISLIDRLEGTE